MTKLIILHGLGQTTEDWKEVTKNVDSDCLTIDLFEDINFDSTVTIESLYNNVSNKLNDMEEPFYTCGLSLGGLLTLMYITRTANPNIKGVVVSGAIYKSIPPLLNSLQTTIFRFLPKSNFEKMGMTRRQVIELIKSINLNLEEELTRLELATLVICGEKDKVNLKSSKQIHQLIEKSSFEIILNGGHELNRDKPLEFSKLLNDFIEATKY